MSLLGNSDTFSLSESQRHTVRKGLELYELAWQAKTPRLDRINKLVPKIARVEYQRLHWKENNGEKLIVSLCPQTKQAIFGKLPREKKKIGRHLRTLCGLCKTPLVKATYDSQNSY